MDVLGNQGGLLVAQDHAQDDAGCDADEEVVAAIIADVMVATRRRTQTVRTIIDAVVVAAIVGRQAIAATPCAIAVIDVAISGGRRAIVPAATIIVAVMAAPIPAVAPVVAPVCAAVAPVVSIPIAVTAAIIVAVTALSGGFRRDG